MEYNKKEWHEANKVQENARCRAWYAANKERVAARQKAKRTEAAAALADPPIGVVTPAAYRAEAERHALQKWKDSPLGLFEKKLKAERHALQKLNTPIGGLYTPEAYRAKLTREALQTPATPL